MTEPDTTTPAPLYGLRCSDLLHRGHGRVYAESAGRHRLESLAPASGCSELVVSHDNGETWETAQ